MEYRVNSRRHQETGLKRKGHKALSVFLSYATEDESHARSLQRVLGTRSPSISFEDCAVVDGFDEEWRRTVLSKMKRCEAVVCLVGPKTHLSEPVNWEIEVTAKQGKPIVALSLEPNVAPLPRALEALGVSLNAWTDSTDLLELVRVA